MCRLPASCRPQTYRPWASARLAALSIVWLVYGIAGRGIAQETSHKSTTAESLLTRLATPQEAEAAKLTDQQRMSVSTLVQERAQALAKAAEADKAGVVADFDKRLAAILTEAQQKTLAKQIPQPRLVFNFRFQKWAEVLDWFAQQCDLSLVLDAPPPGTFNYTDARAYTPPEAIDLLNGVLETKDFTLLRRGRMLMAIDLKNGVPDELVPRIDLKELDEHGKFELVRVMFPLGTRSPSEVEAEIKPLLSRHGRSVALPKTKQILVTDHGGIMRAVAAVINSMPESAATATNAKGQETPVIAVYPLKGADGDAAVTTLKALVPTATFVFDPKSQQVNSYATPTQQAAIKVVMAELQADAPPATRARLELYPIDPAAAESTIQSLASAVPKAQIRLDSANGRLVAWATPSDHQQIKAALAKLSEPVPATTRHVKVYHLVRSDPSAAVSLLQSLLPSARLSVDSSTRSVVALATENEHAAIQTAVERLESQKSETAAKNTLKIYPVSPLQRQRFDAVSRNVLAELPGVRVIRDFEHGELAIWAAPEEHKIVAGFLDKLKAEVPAEQKLELTVHPISSGDPSAVLSLVQKMFPGTHILLDAKSRRLLVWAPLDEQAAIGKALLKLDGASATDTRERMMLFPFSDADPQVAITMIGQQYPDVRIAPDAVSKSIVAWGSSPDLEAVAKIVRQLQTKKPVSQVYRLRSADPNAALTVLQTVFPQARMSADARNRSLVVSAFPEDLLKIRSAVEQMDQAGEGEHSLSLRSYPLASAEAATIVPMLQTLYAASPEVRISGDYKTQSIVALATADQHETIKRSIEEMDKQSAARVLRVYRFRSADPNAAATVLASLAPKAQTAVDNANRSLVVSALEIEHDKIKKMVEEIDGGGTIGGARSLRTYPLSSSDPANVLSVLQTLFAQNADVRLSLDPRTDTLVAFARSDEHATIKKSIDEMESREGSRTAQAYPLAHAQVDAVVAALSGLTPRAQLAVDRRTNSIVANASKGDHLRIKTAVAQMDVPSKAGAATVKAYPLKSANPANVLGTVQALFSNDPSVRISVDPATNALVVLANRDEHATMEQLISQIDGDAGRHRIELEVFTLEAVDPFTAELAIGKLFSNAGAANNTPPTVESNQESQQLFIRGTKEQLAEIRKLLVKMGEPTTVLVGGKGAEPGKQRLRTIRFEGDAESAIREIERVWPRIRGNELRVVVPSAVAPSLRRSVSPPDKPNSESSTVPTGDQPLPNGNGPKQKSAGQGQFSVSDEIAPPLPSVSQKSKSAPNTATQEKPADPRISPQSEPRVKPPAQTKPPEKKPPVIITHGDGSITIASDDPEALDQLEALVRTMSRRSEGRGSDFIVFILRHAAADNIAGLLQQLFRNNPLGFGAFGAGSGRVTAVADDRLNAVVLRGGRGERREIEELLRVLDAPEVPDVLARDSPHLIPIKNMRADQILEVLRGVYRKQLTAMGGRRAIPVPTGVSAEVAAAIQQINASGAGPLLTLEADDESNSIVAMGPASLISEIKKLIGELDAASVKDVSHTLKLVPLESTNSRKLRDVLDRMLERQRQNRPARRSGS